ncbi:MAG: hypothetical protein L0Y54_19770, partial [Sporichthyaceae bacterium]|nr:hypothetical protein [Sporichthyaceae bacterium]
VSAGVNFTNGVAEVADGPALAYFRTAGYGIEEIGDATAGDGPKPPSSRDPKPVWVAYAIAQGVPADRAEAANKAGIPALIEQVKAELEAEAAASTSTQSGDNGAPADTTKEGQS